MKNDFCNLAQQEIQALKVSNTLKGMLLSPFQWNERSGYIMVPVDAFKDMIDVITAHAQALDALARAGCDAEGNP